MAMDGLALRAVVTELQTLVGGKIDKVQQPEKDLLVLTVRTDRVNRRLLIHTHAENGRIQLTERAFDNPQAAPAFCMLLRRRLVGGRILAVTQQGPDRVCTLSVSARNELMDEVGLRLVAELMGKHGNLVLVGADGVILDCLRRVSPSETTLRTMMPGFTYLPPPVQEKADPFAAGPEGFAGAYAAEDPARGLTAAFEGLSRQTAQALVARCGAPEALYNLFCGFAAGRFNPCVTLGREGRPVTALPFLPAGEYEAQPTMSAALDLFYRQRDALTRIQRHGATLRRTVDNALSRTEHKYAACLDALQNGERLEELKRNGELILANLHEAKPGMAFLAAMDYYEDPPVQRKVELDASISLQQNAARLFKQYRKGKTARDYAAGQVNALKEELDYLRGQQANIGNCRTLAELNEISEELVAQEYLRLKEKPPKRQFTEPSRPMRFTSSDGLGIRVGKNNRQNDQLTLREAKSDNLWLHAKNMPGSHVIVESRGMPPERTILEAAALAAYYSAGREDTTVAVDYTERKNVKKPSGARPGMVIYSTNRTVYVAPGATAATPEE